MSIHIEGQIFIDIEVDGKPLAGGNLLSGVSLLEGTACVGPSLKLTVNDGSSRLISDLCLTDGNEISIVTGKSPNDPKTIARHYRYFTRTKPESGQGGVANIIALLDLPKYFLEAPIESYEGTSAQVVKSIAEKCKLDYDGPENFNGRGTQDSQIWLNTGRKRSSFLFDHVVPHGYMDEHSAMRAAVSSLGVLKYRNLADVIETPEDSVKYVFLYNTSATDKDSNRQVYFVRQVKDRSDSGKLNAATNYGATQIIHGLTGDTTTNKNTKVKTSSSFLAINDQVAQTVQKASIKYAHLDCGNCHDNYYNAEYQNKRLLGLFSEVLSILVTEPTEVQLFDPCIYRQKNADPNALVKNSDIYIVVGKTIHVHRGSVYCERLELVRMSLTERGATILKSAEPTTLREKALPSVIISPNVETALQSLPLVSEINAVARTATQAFMAVQQAAQAVSSVLRQGLPNLSLASVTLPDLPGDPAKAIKLAKNILPNIQSAITQVDLFNTSLSNAVQKFSEVNTSLIDGQYSEILRTTIAFRPNGIVQNFSALLGTNNLVESASALYGQVGESLAESRTNVGLYDSGSIPDIDAAVNAAISLLTKNVALRQIVAQGFNEVLHNVVGSAPSTTVPNASYNNLYLNRILSETLTPSGDRFAYKQVDQVADLFTDVVRIRDSTKNPPWVAPTSYTAPRVSKSGFSVAVQSFKAAHDTAQKQTRDFLKGMSDGS